jgi:hypothetical protein
MPPYSFIPMIAPSTGWAHQMSALMPEEASEQNCDPLRFAYDARITRMN